jgi:hypothetical protein
MRTWWEKNQTLHYQEAKKKEKEKGVRVSQSPSRARFQ